MSKFSYSIPSEFSDEDKYLKYFRKKDLAVLMITAGTTILLYKITGAIFNKPYIGLIIGLIIVAISLFCSMFTLPATFILTGGGQSIGTILMKRLIRKKKRILYVRGYGERRDD